MIRRTAAHTKLLAKYFYFAMQHKWRARSEGNARLPGADGVCSMGLCSTTPMPGLKLDMQEVMQKTAVMLLTLLLALAGIGLPIWLAIEESERQAFKAESAHALGYARDVVLRANETGQQVQAAVERLAPYTAAPCAQASLDEMREIDLGSTYIQAVGYVQGDSMPCSSILGTARRLDLGPPDYVSADGARIWRAARFPFAPQERFLVLQYGMFAAILHAQLALDTAKSEPDVALAVLPFDFPQPISARGAVDPAWLARLGKAREAVFVDGEQLVAVARSTTGWYSRNSSCRRSAFLTAYGKAICRRAK